MSFTWPGLIALLFIAAACLIGYQRGFIREAVSTVFLILSVAIVFYVNPYVNSFLKENTALQKTLTEKCAEFAESTLPANYSGTLTAAQQEQAIEDLSLPALLTDWLLKNNTSEVYEKLGVTKFIDYVSQYLASVILNALSFMLTWILVSVLLRLLSYILNLFSRLPVISTVNKAAGAVLGGGKCLVFIWIAMLIATILCETGPGYRIMETIRNDRILNWLYSANPLSRYFANAFYGR